MTFEGRPATERDDTARLYQFFPLRINQDKVGKEAWTEEASLLDPKEFGWLVSHLLYDKLLGEYPFTS